MGNRVEGGAERSQISARKQEEMEMYHRGRLSLAYSRAGVRIFLLLQANCKQQTFFMCNWPSLG